MCNGCRIGAEIFCFLSMWIMSLWLSWTNFSTEFLLCLSWTIYFLFKKIFIIFIYFYRRGKGGRKTGKETLIWPAPETFQFARWCPIHWATSVRAFLEPFLCRCIWELSILLHESIWALKLSRVGPPILFLFFMSFLLQLFCIPMDIYQSPAEILIGMVLNL